MLHLRDSAARTAHLSGRVIITPTGQGMQAVTVEAWNNMGDWNETQTIADGHYALNLSPGRWNGGPVLTEEQAADYLLLPPRRRNGMLIAGEVISNVNFFLKRRDATIKGQLLNESGNVITDTESTVFAEICPPTEHCFLVAEEDVQGGAFELHVVGGLTYTLSVDVHSAGYMPADSRETPIAAGETITGQDLTLIEAGTKIYGTLLDRNTGQEVKLEAYVHGSSAEGQWVDDNLSPDMGDDYGYELYVPTPDAGTGPITWTLGVWVAPQTGYVPDQEAEVVLDPGETAQHQVLYVKKLTSVITGRVTVESVAGAAVPHVIVFAQGYGNEAAGLYFETATDANGLFTMTVLPGEYYVGAYLPPHLATEFFRPAVHPWASADDNPIRLVFRRRPTGDEALEICGDLAVTGGALPADAEISVFGWARGGSHAEVTGTLASGYCMEVTSNATWHVWAAYEDPDQNSYYESQERIVHVGTTDETQDLTLTKSGHELPDPLCWSFDPTRNKRLTLPARDDLFSPLVDISAGTMPVTGTVQVCATPRAALPNGQNLIGFAYELEARDSQGNLITQNFNQSVRLSFYFNAAALGDVPPEELQLFYYSTVRQEWIVLDDLYVDVEDLFATGKIDHFTRIGIMSTPSTETEHKIYLPLVLKN